MEKSNEGVQERKGKEKRNTTIWRADWKEMERRKGDILSVINDNNCNK